MTTPIPSLPPEGNQAWYGHYTALDTATKELQTLVNGMQATIAALTAPSGLVFTVNGVTPDPATGDVALAAADVNALPDSYSPGYADLPLGNPTYVYKDATTGFWPTGYNADGSAVYTSGSASAGVRPHARATPVIWVGAEPSPASVASGTGGMLQGYDERAIPNP